MKLNHLWNLTVWVALSLALASAASAQVDVDDDDEITDAHAPIQFYLQATMSDHVNLQITEDRVRRVLSLLDKYRNAHPDSGLTATIFFSGAVSDALAARNAQTHIVDLVKDATRRGLVEVGYDGADEPTYKKRPLVEMKEDTPEGRWLSRSSAAERFLTEARDPITGAPQPGKTGGIERMEEVFGKAACIKGIVLSFPTLANTSPDFGSDSEVVHRIRHQNDGVVMFGLPEESPVHSVAYRGWSEKFSNDLSPYMITPPELYWQDDVLRTSESVGVDNNLFLASNGPAALSYVFKRLNRNRIRIIHIDLASERSYLTKPFRGDFIYPPTRYAYGHPDHPELPSQALRDKAAVEASFAKEDELLEWLTGDYLPEHHESHFWSNAGLKKTTAPAYGFEVTMPTLAASMTAMLKSWGDQPAPPKYVSVGDFYFLSLAETFQVLADALAEQRRTGKLPASVRVAEVHGPLQVFNGPRAPVHGEVTGDAVSKVASELAAKLHDNHWQPVPYNVVPISVKIDGMDLNPAEFLRLMAEALSATSSSARLEIKPATMFATHDFLTMRTRAARDMGVVWTYKPAPLSLREPLVSALQ